MSAIDEFAAKHVALLQAKGTPSDHAEVADRTLVLPVIVLSIDTESIAFGHLDTEFVVPRNQVEELAETTDVIANPFGRGAPALLRLKPDTWVTTQARLPARALVEGVPFAIARPSLRLPGGLVGYTPSELDWLEKLRGRLGRAGVFTNPNIPTASTTATVTRCDTVSDGGIDDQVPCDDQLDDTKADDTLRDLPFAR